MRRLNIKWVLFFLIISFYSCTKVISVNLNDTSPQIVIEGNIYSTAGPYQVQVTSTVNFSESNVSPAVSGAIIKLTDNTSNTTDMLTEVSPGIYNTHNIQGIPGHTYQLNVNAAGKIYTASSTMPATTALDSITFQHNNIFGNSRINCIVNFKDSVGIPNYYTFTQFVNTKRLKNPFVYDDRLSDGKYISQQIFADSAYIKVGDTVLLQMNCIDKAVWNYFNTLGQATNGNNFQSVTPANPISNISNNALGYFSASAVSSKQRIAR